MGKNGEKCIVVSDNLVVMLRWAVQNGPPQFKAHSDRGRISQERSQRQLNSNSCYVGAPTRAYAESAGSTDKGCI